MKIILSRKGFDTANGGFPSPILPDGRMISLPIPLDDNIHYSDLKVDPYGTYFDLMMNLKGKIRNQKQWHDLTMKTRCHLDPDIIREVFPTAHKNNWKPVFGQRNAAQSHLENEGVIDEKDNDLFLFFGTFRKTIDNGDGLKFDPNDKPKHIIYGYLQVGEILKIYGNIKCPPWLQYHPHMNVSRRTSRNNTIYVSKDILSWDVNRKGAGAFIFDENLVLTKEACSKSKWRLKDFFGKRVKITYHNEGNWKAEGYFQSNSIGQEFVFSADKKVEEWAKDLICNAKIF